MKDWIIIIGLSIVVLAGFGFALLMPYIEAREFNRCTGGNASYLTALTTQLRIESCDK